MRSHSPTKPCTTSLYRTLVTALTDDGGTKDTCHVYTLFAHGSGTVLSKGQSGAWIRFRVSGSWVCRDGPLAVDGRLAGTAQHRGPNAQMTPQRGRNSYGTRGVVGAKN